MLSFRIRRSSVILAPCCVLAMLAVSGCSSSSGNQGSARMPCEDRYDEVFSAAQSAVIRLGGRVVHSSRTSGSILGRIDVDVHGFGVELSITLSRLPDHVPGTQEPITVTVRATEPGVQDPDPERAKELHQLEKMYMSMVGERASCGPPY
jgi:hypothetical protein